jgi:ParB family transcriptional regulator, chromosome partitioning protein
LKPPALTLHLDLALIDEPERPLRDAIDPGPLSELADSMAAEGLHQPIGVRGPDPDGRYRVVWGHRRLLAARLLQWPDIEAKVFPPGFADALARVSENLQRTDLTPVEEAHAVEQMLALGHSRASVARLFRRSASWVDARLGLLQLPEALRAAVHEGRLTLGVAYALAEVDHEDYRAELVAEAERTGATAATASIWVAHYKSDRTRFIANRATVQEMTEARSKFIVYYPCDVCHTDTDYTDTRALRLCADCASGLARALADARTTQP